MPVKIETKDGRHLIREAVGVDDPRPAGRVFGEIVAHLDEPYGPGWRIHFTDGTVSADCWYSFDAAMLAAEAYQKDHEMREYAFRESGLLGAPPEIWPYNEDPENPLY